MKVNDMEHNSVGHNPLENLKTPQNVITAFDHLIDLPGHHDIFPEDLEVANKKQPKIKILKMLYPKNGLYGLL
jgi:hypothetical protein